MIINPGYIISKIIRYINRPALRNCNIDKTSKIGTGSNCIGVTMGRYSYMGKNNSVTNAEIGSFCSIASYCAIGGGAHDLTAVSTSPVFQEGRNVFGVNLGHLKSELNNKVVIGNDVWIGENVFINDGITIGNGAVIGAHSVVTHDVPDYAIVAGVPAKVIRYRFAQETVEKLTKDAWWNKSEQVLRESSFENADEYFLSMRKKDENCTCR